MTSQSRELSKSFAGKTHGLSERCDEKEILCHKEWVDFLGKVGYTIEAMKKDIHPQNYRPVLFIDNSNNAEFIISSTVVTTETAKAKDKKEYPVYRLEISSASHPFYTGNEKILDTAGRAEKFRARVATAKAKKAKKVTKK